jgi:glyoxylase-like metal-dependent hydrolase (beta-lactamase superfamily II)
MAPIKEIAPDIFKITQTLSLKQLKFSVNVYVIAGENGLIFDSGYGSRQAGNSLVRSIHRISGLMKDRGQPFRITRAMSSHGHWDHFSGLQHLQRTLGIDILATQKQAEKLGSKKKL